MWLPWRPQTTATGDSFRTTQHTSVADCMVDCIRHLGTGDQECVSVERSKNSDECKMYSKYATGDLDSSERDNILYNIPMWYKSESKQSYEILLLCKIITERTKKN